MAKRTSKAKARRLPLRELAMFRYQLRRFLRFSERAARAHGVTPQQHQLLLGLAGFTRTGSATISEMAEFLQERHNAVVGLVQRAAGAGLVRKARSARDRREVRVSLTASGARTLRKLTELHLQELKQLRTRLPEALAPRSHASNHRTEA